MELFKEFSDLKISKYLFKDVKFYVTGSVADWILKLLTNGGAKQESHITDFMTHLIAGTNPDENEIGEVKDIYEKPVVTHNWVIYSAKCGRKLPVEGFSKDSSQLFSGIKVSVSKLGIEDSRTIWGLVNFYGGSCTLDLDHTCTHLIVGKPEGIKFQRALEKPILIVTPDWVTDSVNGFERKDEYLYHPRLLNTSPVPQVLYKSAVKLRKPKKLPKRTVEILEGIPVVKEPIEESIKDNILPKQSEKQILFNALDFSDDEDIDPERNSLLDQLKSSQPWKKSPTPPSSSILPILSEIQSVSSPSDSSKLDKPVNPVCASVSTDATLKVAATVASTISSVSSISVTGSSPFLQNSFASGKVASVSTSEKSLTSTSLSNGDVVTCAAAVTGNSSQSMPTASSALGNFSSSIKSTSEVDISYISKSLSQIATSSPAQSVPSLAYSLSSTLASVSSSANTSSTTYLHGNMKSEVSSSFSGKPMARLLGQGISTVPVQVARPSHPNTTSLLQSFPKSNISISHSTILHHQRQMLGPLPALYSSGGQISTSNLSSYVQMQQSSKTPQLTLQPQIPSGLGASDQSSLQVQNSGQGKSQSVPLCTLNSSGQLVQTQFTNAEPQGSGTAVQQLHSGDVQHTFSSTVTQRASTPASLQLATSVTQQSSAAIQLTPDSVEQQTPLTLIQHIPTVQQPPITAIQQSPNVLQQPHPAAIIKQSHSLVHQTPTTALLAMSASGGPFVTEPVTTSNVHLQIQQNSSNQSAIPIQVVRQNSSVSIVGSQDISGGPNVPSRTQISTSQVSISGGKGGVSSLTQLQQNSNLTLSSSAGQNMAQQQVHSVAIPGAVVRLPAGVTHQQLQMMSDEERHKFLEQLHKKQIEDQQHRGMLRPGKPVTALQYKAPPLGLRFSSTVQTPQAQTQSPQVSGAWPSSVTQTRIRLGGVSAPQESSHPQDQVQPQSPSSGGAINWQQHHQPQTQPQGQVPTQQQLPSAVSTQSQPPPPPPPHPTTQQHFVTTQGTTRVMVGQPGWQHQQQQPVAGGQTGQPQSALPPQGLPQQVQQVQVHAQQLRQHFPHLTQQEAQLLIQTIPTHLREIQARDSMGKMEYLASLDPKERQVVNHFYMRRHQQQMLQRQQLQAQQQAAQLKIGTPQHSPNTWQQQQQQQQPQQPAAGQFITLSPHARPIPNRPLPQGYNGQTVVAAGQGSPHMVQGGQLTPHVSPLASPHGHSPIQRNDGPSVIPHPALQGSTVAQNLLSQQNLVNPKTKTALANLLTNRLSGSAHPPGTVVPQGAQSPIDVATHIVQKQEGGPGGEQVVVYQRRTLANITGTMTNNTIRAPVPGGAAGPPTPILGTSYPRVNVSGQPTGTTGTIGSSAPHYPRPHLFGHDINTMLPRELCMVGCVFYIADYHSDVTPNTLSSYKRVIQQHGGEVVNLYDSARVTHVLCKHQKSPVFQQAVRENKRCITIHWVNDILIRGKMAPPWQAIHLPTPFGTKDQPMKGLLVSVTGFENEERTAIKLMLQLAGAKYTGYFSKQNNLLVCKKFEGVKVTKAREWKRAVVNGMWLSEVLLGQNTPPLVYQGTRYQHYLDDALRIDSSLASHLFNAWKFPISVSKESVEKAKSVREMALRKRKTETEGEQENKRTRLDPPQLGQLNSTPSNSPPAPSDVPAVAAPKRNLPDQQRPRILLSWMKNKEEMERKASELGAILARTNAEATHLVMGVNSTAPRTIKLLCAVSCAQYIVSSEWLIDSHVQEKFLDEKYYCLRMPEYEHLFDFRLSETLQKPNRRELLKGFQFYMTPSVVPGRTWLKEIIECGGGIVDAKRKPLHDIKERNSESVKYICITTTNDAHLLKDVIQEKLPAYFSEFVLMAVLRQRIDFQLGIFSEDENNN